jgi:hypothetical protein
VTDDPVGVSDHDGLAGRRTPSISAPGAAIQPSHELRRKWAVKFTAYFLETEVGEATSTGLALARRMRATGASRRADEIPAAPARFTGSE